MPFINHRIIDRQLLFVQCAPEHHETKDGESCRLHKPQPADAFNGHDSDEYSTGKQPANGKQAKKPSGKRTFTFILHIQSPYISNRLTQWRWKTATLVTVSRVYPPVDFIASVFSRTYPKIERWGCSAYFPDRYLDFYKMSRDLSSSKGLIFRTVRFQNRFPVRKISRTIAIWISSVPSNLSCSKTGAVPYSWA